MNNESTAISAELLDLLRCPESASRLVVADPALLAQLNRAIAHGQLHNEIGQRIEQPIESALINADRSLAYPVIERIPVMVPGEAIRLSDSLLAEALPPNPQSG